MLNSPLHDLVFYFENTYRIRLHVLNNNGEAKGDYPMKVASIIYIIKLHNATNVVNGW